MRAMKKVVSMAEKRVVWTAVKWVLRKAAEMALKWVVEMVAEMAIASVA